MRVHTSSTLRNTFQGSLGAGFLATAQIYRSREKGADGPFLGVWVPLGLG